MITIKIQFPMILALVAVGLAVGFSSTPPGLAYLVGIIVMVVAVLHGLAKQS